MGRRISEKSASGLLWKRWLHTVMEWVLGFHGSPHQVARGLAVGVFVAFTPTLGLQMIIAAVLATLCHANRAAAVAAVWITNPLTAVPIYTMTFMVGGTLMPGTQPKPTRQRLAAVFVDDAGEWFDLPQQVREMARMGAEFLVPLTLGGCLVGLAAGAVTYPLVLWAIRLAHHLRPPPPRNPWNS